MRKKIASCISVLILCVLCMAGGFHSQFKGDRKAARSSMEDLLYEAELKRETMPDIWMQSEIMHMRIWNGQLTGNIIRKCKR